MKAVTAAQMQAIEQRSVEAGVSLDALMENAGLAVADAVAARLGSVFGSVVTILVGPGNNGSDGLVAGRHLASRGAKVRAFALTGRPDRDEKRELAEAAGVEFVAQPEVASDPDAFRNAISRSDVVLDAVLGTGRARVIDEPLAGTLRSARELAWDLVALDLPTGMDADTGDFDEFGLPANLTLMLGYPKFGPLITAGEGACGEVKVLDIGIPDGLANEVSAEWITPELARSLLPDRHDRGNKGSFGKTLIAGGSRNYLGAPMLATRAAVRSGAGLVYVAVPQPVYELVAGQVNEAIYLPLAASDGEINGTAASEELLAAASGMDSVLVGPGLGQSAGAVGFVEWLVRSLPEDVPVVLDADALNIVSRMPNWSELLRPTTVLTPHPGEMARLLRCSVTDVQDNRPAAAKEAAGRFGATVVLKGAATLVANPGGELRISPWVNSGLAKGGTGDVLAGLLAGLLAQSPEAPFDVAALGVYLHGLAGDIARANVGARGMTAGDVADAVPEAFRMVDR